MEKVWAVSFGGSERMELERIMVDDDEPAALEFLREVIYPKVKESEKPGACFRDVDKTIDELPRQVDRHKKMGSF